MINVSGEFTINTEGYNAEENSFTVQHNIQDVVAAPLSITKKTPENDYEEFGPKAIEFYDTYIKIYLGSLVIGAGDIISYQFSVGTGGE